MTATLAEQEVVDFGAHLYPPDAFPDPEWDEVAKMKNGVREITGPVLTDPAELLARYTDAGIDYPVLSQPYYMGHHDVATTAAANDALYELVRNEDRFYGLAAIPVGAGGSVAADEFERCLEMGYHGGALETKSSGIELIDPELDPVFEVANRTGAPLLVHPKLKASLSEDVLTDRYRLNAIFGREAALSESLCKVIHEGVLDRYPNLNLVYHHLGGNIPSMLGRIHLELDPGRWPGQEHVKPFGEFRAQLEERVFLDTSGFFNHSNALRSAMEKLPASQLLFGTDFPFESRTPAELGKTPELVCDIASSEEADALLYGNAMELLVNV